MRRVISAITIIVFITAIIYIDEPKKAHAATAPSFIQEAETVWNTSTSPKTTASFDVQAGDVLVAYAVEEGFSTLGHIDGLTIDGGSLSWTQQEAVAVQDYSWVSIWTATVDTNKSMTVTFTEIDVDDPALWGANVLTFRDSDGIGAAEKENADNEAGGASLNITTTQVNSAIVVVQSDWDAIDGASRTWRENAGTLNEQSYFRDGSHYTIYAGYHADAGAIGTYAVGVSSPTLQKHSLAAVEIKGDADGGGSNTRTKQFRIFRGVLKIIGGRLKI